MNIQLGKGVKSFGLVYFYRHKNSQITIGNNCIFRSAEHSNLIGINRKCSISTLAEGAKISIGNKSGLSGTVVGAFKSIIIGNEVKVGANVLITDGDWHSDDNRAGEPKDVKIGDNVWLGEGVKVLKGVTIGDNTLIGAGSVVVKDIPPNVIAAGNPCKILKNIK